MAVTSYKGLKKYCYFSPLSDSALEALFNKMQSVQYSAGEEIMKKGSPADAFYFIGTGEVEVTKTLPSGEVSVTSVSGIGDTFGEMVLLTCSARDCSVTAKTGVSALKLLRSDFEDIAGADFSVSDAAIERSADYFRFHQIRSLQPFAHLEPGKVAALTDKLKEKKYSAGENIITQGEKGDLYYIIRSGKVSVMKVTDKDEPEHAADLGAGEGFGEEALITDSPRNATVRAVEDTVVWTLSKEDFDRIARAAFVKEVNAEEVLMSREERIDYLDVRTRAEFEEEHLPGAINIPLDELRQRCSELYGDRNYYVYCLVGARSATASFLINNRGLKALSIKGGILNWPGAVEKQNDGIHAPFKPT